MNARRQRVLSFVLLAGLAAPWSVEAQQPQQQMQHMQQMQEQAMRMQESMQQMQRLQARAHEMEQQMLRQMEQLRQQEMLREQDQVRLREQERIRDMAHAMSTAAGFISLAFERARDMLRDPGGAWGPEMQQDMERLRERMNEMAGSMNEGLAILERLRDRISQG